MDVLRYLLTEWPLDLLVPVGAAAAAGAAGYNFPILTIFYNKQSVLILWIDSAEYFNIYNRHSTQINTLCKMDKSQTDSLRLFRISGCGSHRDRTTSTIFQNQNKSLILRVNEFGEMVN